MNTRLLEPTLAEKTDLTLENVLLQFNRRLLTLLFDIEPTKIHKQIPHLPASLNNGQEALDFGLTGEIDDSVLHLVCLPGNDPHIAERMLLHNGLLRWKYQKSVLGVVAYMGQENTPIKKQIKDNGINYKFMVLDARDMSPDLFLSSGVPGDWSFAILTGREKDKSVLISEILHTMQGALTNDPVTLKECLHQLAVLASFRGDKIKLQLQKQVAFVFNNIKIDIAAYGVLPDG